MIELRKKLFILTDRVNYRILIANLIKWIILGSIIGVVIGAIASLFLNVLQIATNTRINYQWLIFFLPLGGAIVSFLYTKYGKVSLQGNNLILDQIHEGDREIPLRMAPLVFIGTIITHLLGGSAGRLGAVLQIGGSIAEHLGEFFKLDKADRRLMLMCGISSAFGSVFGTPLAGTIFGMEVISIGRLEYGALIPCFVASFSGSLVSSVLGTKYPHYIIRNIPQVSILTIIKVIIASILFAVISIIFTESIHACKRLFSRLFKSRIVRSIMGGLIIIILTLIIGRRDYLGLGTSVIADSFEKIDSATNFFWKIVFTSITLGSGFQSGEVTPAFFVGSTFGNTLGGIMNLSPSFLAALGLVSVFCGATNTLITSFFLGLELFQGQAIIYMFICCVVSYFFSGDHGIYTSQKIYCPKCNILEIHNNVETGFAKINEEKIYENQ